MCSAHPAELSHTIAHVRREGLNFPKYALITAATIGSALLGSVAALSTHLDMKIVGPTAVACALVALCRLRVGTFLHPALLLSSAFLIFGLLGFLVYPSVAAEGSIPEVLALNAESSRAALFAFMTASCGTAIGGLFTHRGNSRQGKITSYKLEIGSARPPLRYGLLAFSALVVILYIAGSQVSALLYRPTYQGFYGQYVELMRFGLTFSLPCALLMCFFIVSTSVTRVEAVVATIVLGALSALALATASRELATYPLLILIAYVGSRGRLPGVLRTSAALATSVGLFSSAIVWRLSGRHGLIPYVEKFLAAPLETATGKINSMVANILTGFPTAAYVISSQAGTLDYHDIIFNLDPRPASWIGYDAVENGYAIVSYMPYGTVGMLGSAGAAFNFGYFLVAGIAFTFTWQKINTLPSFAAVLNPIILGGTVLFLLISNEYPLRQSARLGSFLLFSVLAFYWIARLLGSTEPSFGRSTMVRLIPVQKLLSRSGDAKARAAGGITQ